MITSISRLRLYWAYAVTDLKSWIDGAPWIWFWAWTLKHLIMMVIFVNFWDAIFASRETVGGLTREQTVSYALLAEMIATQFSSWSYVPIFGARLRNGNLAVALTWPLDYQGRFYLTEMVKMFYFYVRDNVISFPIALLFLGLKLPGDIRVWGAFLVTLVLGYSVMHCFDWAYGTVAFYVEAYWGIHLMREGLVLFFSGALLPLAMMPGWLQTVASWLPFGHAVYSPVAVLTGIIPLEQAPRVWLGQLMWLGALFLLSRLLFARALRRVAINGG